MHPAACATQANTTRVYALELGSFADSFRGELSTTSLSMRRSPSLRAGLDPWASVDAVSLMRSPVEAAASRGGAALSRSASQVPRAMPQLVRAQTGALDLV